MSWGRRPPSAQASESPCLTSLPSGHPGTERCGALTWQQGRCCVWFHGYGQHLHDACCVVLALTLVTSRSARSAFEPAPGKFWEFYFARKRSIAQGEKRRWPCCLCCVVCVLTHRAYVHCSGGSEELMRASLDVEKHHASVQARRSRRNTARVCGGGLFLE